MQDDRSSESGNPYFMPAEVELLGLGFLTSGIDSGGRVCRSAVFRAWSTRVQGLSNRASGLVCILCMDFYAGTLRFFHEGPGLDPFSRVI